MSDYIGNWDVTVSTPVGKQSMAWTITDEGGVLAIASESKQIVGDFGDVAIDGDKLTTVGKLSKPFPISLPVSVTLKDATTFEGTAETGMFPPSPMVGTKVS